jgi:hypothetical protein
MRQLSVLTAVALTVVVTSSAFGGALTATDPPDIRLLVGTPLTDAFDLNDFFVGGELADGTVDVPGAAAPGISMESYDITVGADTVTVSNTVKVSSFLVANGPAIDGLAGGGANPFIVALRPGVAASSVAALVGSTGGGQAVTPPAVTAPAGWSVTIGTVSQSYVDGQRVRSSSLIAGPGQPSQSAGGLTAEIDAAGNYTLTSDASFGGPVVVTFISSGSGGLDSASVLAAASLPAGADYSANDAPQTISGTADAPGRATYPAVSVSGEVTVSVDCTASAGVVVALALLDAPGGAPTGDLAYVNPIAQGGTMTLSVTYASPSGSIIPLVQAVGGQATFSNLVISSAPAVPDLAVGANEVDLAQVTPALAAGAAIAGDFNAITDVAATFPVSPNSAPGAPALSSDNNFGASGQSIALGEADAAGFDNITVIAQASAPGHVKGTLWAKGAGHLDLVMIQLGAAGQQTAIGNQGGFSSANWAPVSCAGQLYQAGTLLVVAQGVGGGADSIMVDDLKVTQVMDLPEYFDAALLGL